MFTRSKPDLFEESMEDTSSVQNSGIDDKKIFFALLVLSSLTILGILNLLFTAVVAFKKPPTLVRDVVNGESFRVRTDETPVSEKDVQRYVVNKVNELHSWSGLIEHEKYPGRLVQDPGVLITNGSGRRVTTPAYEASFALNEAIRIPFLTKIAEQTPQSVFDNDPSNVGRGVYTIIRDRRWLGPEKLPDGRWKVTIIADVLAFSPDTPQGRAVAKFNKDIFVRESPEIPLLYNNSAYQQLAYVNRAEGFEIDLIVDTKRKELNAPR